MKKELIKRIHEHSGNVVVTPIEENSVVVLFSPEERKQAVHCETQEQWNFVTNVKKYKWNSGVWGHYKKDSRIDLSEKGYGVSFVNENGFQDISFSEYLEQESLMEEWRKFLIGEAEKRGFLKYKHRPSCNDKIRPKCAKIKFNPNWTDDESCLSDAESGNVIWRSKKGWAEIIKPIFRTEDRVDVYEGDKTIAIGKDTLKLLCNGEFKQYLNNEPSFLYFSTREAAEKYIDENKPIELMEGEIYVIKKSHVDHFAIFRSKGDRGVYAEIVNGKFYKNIFIGGDEIIKNPTPDQKKQLIKAEIKNGFYWELEKND